jgi:hypothetical protein
MASTHAHASAHNVQQIFVLLMPCWLVPQELLACCTMFAFAFWAALEARRACAQKSIEQHMQRWRAEVNSRRKRRAANLVARKKRQARLDEICPTLRLRILYDTGVIAAKVKGHLTITMSADKKSTRLQFNGKHATDNWDLHVNCWHWQQSCHSLQFNKSYTVPNSKIQETYTLPAYHTGDCVVIQLMQSKDHKMPSRTLIAVTPKFGTAWFVANAADQCGVRGVC